ncbi:MAG TPA: 16S rRNA (adenine(1518)-N(6)/adenine(1519)-N(6))-dimethyltransferase RsmA [Puia sp.]|nr:16S rRNA (adenine(1518)-N(6)/adenine(1519)-N(6))-dimethyltransferase RsmA [Puia sp.]
MYTLKKSLGQHFLRDENISRKIVAALRQRPFTRLLEVGPGAGALTKYLLELEGVDLKAVELDDEKLAYLRATWPALDNRLIHGSILDIEKPFEGKFTVIGNFPYNISSQILFKMLDWKEDLQTMIGMFQKEVAQRVAAKEGSKTYGVLSVLIQAFFDVEYLFEVHEQCFNPPPKVKSAVIRLTPRQAPAFRDEKSFFLLVKTAFNQRRKTLRNAVKPLFDEAALQDPVFGKRAEQLSVADFAQLTRKMR